MFSAKKMSGFPNLVQKFMKTLQRIVVVVLLLILITIAGGYFYFDQKFTPEKNYLTIENESGNVPMIWADSNKSALLLPTHFPGDSTTYYLQFDTGAVYTELYSPVIEKIKAVSIRNGCAVSSFYIGKLKLLPIISKFSIPEKVWRKCLCQNHRNSWCRYS